MQRDLSATERSCARRCPARLTVPFEDDECEWFVRGWGPSPVRWRGGWAAAIDNEASPADLVQIGFKEIEYLLDLAPQHLWLVGPGTVDPAAHVWSVTLDGLAATFTRVDDCPSPQLGDSNIALLRYSLTD